MRCFPLVENHRNDMPYFNERHSLAVEYSGYEELSSGLVSRLVRVCAHYTVSRVNGDGFCVPSVKLEHQLGLHLMQENMRAILTSGEYGSAFTALEIFLRIAHREAGSKFPEILKEIKEAFRLSGSVYSINQSLEIYLTLDKEQAESLEEMKEILFQNPTAYQLFFDSVGKFVTRQIEPKVLVNNLWISYENFIKELTGENDFDPAIKKLQREGRILSVQRNVVEKLYGYRSSAGSVAHDGSEGEPGEVDALWFLETLMAQIKVAKRKASES